MTAGMLFERLLLFNTASQDKPSLVIDVDDS